MTLTLGFVAMCCSVSPTQSTEVSCGYEVQKDCLLERTTKHSCIQCAKSHEEDLIKAGCTEDQQVERLCRGAKPVVGGFDVVEYFSMEPTELGVLGTPEFTYNLTSPDADGSPRFTYQFWFSTQKNREKFAADPWKYAPKYGGF